MGLKEWLDRTGRHNQAVLEGRVPDSRTRHPILYAASSGFLFFALSWGFLHFPLWFSAMSGVGMTLAYWSGWRPNGWARRLFTRPDKPQRGEDNPRSRGN